MAVTSYETLRIASQGPVCRIQLHRPDANNTINACMLAELHHVLDDAASREQTVIVIEGLPDYFCFGADLTAVSRPDEAGDPERIYALWSKISGGPFVTVAHVRGKVNAGGMGFVAASDIVIAAETARFSLSELLFGLMPATLMPFLVRRIGFQKAHYLAIMTQPVTAAEALAFGLVDACGPQSDGLLRRHLLPLRRLSRRTIIQYKKFMADIGRLTVDAKDLAIATNRRVFADPANIARIERYVKSGVFPWEGETAR
jgi:polyketide biosynthesis enoyl-CoA hydratase PksH